jgi:flagellar hook-length control protein FliK
VTADSRQTIEGQTITVQAAATSLVGAPGGIQPTANTPARNINDAYIHAHLPSNAAIKAETSTDNSLDDSAQGQSTGENGFSQNIDKQAVAEQILTFKGLAASATESQPFLFNHQQAGSQSGAMPLPLESSMYRLASGLPVPEGTVTDQIIAHFSANKRLESGSVNLKLYPQELGELRMEIKVDQDNVKAHIIAQSPQAQEMIDRHMPRLREALEQQGLHLQHIEVSVATQDNGANERFQDNGARRQAAHGLASSNSPNLFEDQLEEELDIQAQLDSNLSVIA